MDRRHFLLTLLVGGCAQSHDRVLRSFWTLWGVEPDADPDPVRHGAFLTREECEKSRVFLERWAREGQLYVEEEHGIMHLRRRPSKNSPPPYRCLPYGESYK